jgi:hypothetical protein
VPSHHHKCASKHNLCELSTPSCQLTKSRLQGNGGAPATIHADALLLHNTNPTKQQIPSQLNMHGTVRCTHLEPHAPAAALLPCAAANHPLHSPRVQAVSCQHQQQHHHRHGQHNGIHVATPPSAHTSLGPTKQRLPHQPAPTSQGMPPPPPPGVCVSDHATQHGCMHLPTTVLAQPARAPITASTAQQPRSLSIHRPAHAWPSLPLKRAAASSQHQMFLNMRSSLHHQQSINPQLRAIHHPIPYKIGCNPCLAACLYTTAPPKLEPAPIAPACLVSDDCEAHRGPFWPFPPWHTT